MYSEEEAKELVIDFEERANLSKSHRGIATFSILYDEGPIDLLHMACHAYLRDKPQHAFSIITLSSMRKKFEKYERYLDWLLNRSPFAEASYIKDPYFVFDHGIAASTCVPASTMQGLHVLYRATWESGRHESFTELVNRGVSENLAFLISGQTTGWKRGLKGEKWWFRPPMSPHAPFINLWSRKRMLNFIHNSKPCATKPYYLRTIYSGVEKAFNDEDNSFTYLDSIEFKKELNLFFDLDPTIAFERDELFDRVASACKKMEEKEWLVSS